MDSVLASTDDHRPMLGADVLVLRGTPSGRQRRLGGITA